MFDWYIYNDEFDGCDNEIRSKIIMKKKQKR